MFNGSRVYQRVESNQKPKFPLFPQEFRTSWRKLGDPEILNPDGYSFRWSPYYDSGSELPIFNYYEGKFTKGTPTSNINAYLNFYSNEERHMFEHDQAVSRTYHIFLPPGPVTAGYAIEACWEPPINEPVQNPVTDFPYSANQPEAVRFNYVVNEGLSITLDDLCCFSPPTVEQARVEVDYWYYYPNWHVYDYCGAWSPEFANGSGGYGPLTPCNGPDNWYCMFPHAYYKLDDGYYQFLAFIWYDKDFSIPIPEHLFAVTLFELEIDLHD
jgi:hypothetical protein